MSKPHEFVIDAGGTIRGIHSDTTMPVLVELGDIRIERASHVEYDNQAKAWGVWTRAGVDTGQRFPTRAAALAWEVENWSELAQDHVPWPEK